MLQQEPEQILEQLEATGRRVEATIQELGGDAASPAAPVQREPFAPPARQPRRASPLQVPSSVLDLKLRSPAAHARGRATKLTVKQQLLPGDQAGCLAGQGGAQRAALANGGAATATTAGGAAAAAASRAPAGGCAAAVGRGKRDERGHGRRGVRALVQDRFALSPSDPVLCVMCLCGV